jgi:methylmalonyl-CoA mutase
VSNSDPFYQDEFPAASYGTWRPRVEQELRGASFEKTLCHRLADGFEIQPLYSEETAPTGHDPARFPGVFPFTRGASLPRSGAGWWIGSEIADSDPAAARKALLGDLELGAELLWLRFGGPGGLAFSGSAAADALLEGVEPRFIKIVLDAGAEAPQVAMQLIGWARRAGIESETLHGCLGCDPLGTLAWAGRLPKGLAEAWREVAELAAFCAAEAPEMRAALVSTAVWHRAGATPAWEVGLGLAAGLETLRALERHGIEPSRAAHQILFAHELGSEIFLEIAKQRAMRTVWSKVVAASGAGEVAAADQRHVAISSSVAATRVDPWVNLLRTTAQTFAAAVGGADGLVIRPWDAPLGRPEAGARRFALTSQYVLAQESHLRAVADPAGGSWALESLTDGLARQAWSIAQDVEKRGGLAAAIESGYVKEKLAELAAIRRRDVARRKTQIVGVSVFPLLGEERPVRAAIEASGLGDEMSRSNETAENALSPRSSPRHDVPARPGPSPQSGALSGDGDWIPAFAGMTVGELRDSKDSGLSDTVEGSGSDFLGEPEGGTPSVMGSPPSPSAERGAGGRGPETAPPLEIYRPAEDFEELRLAAYAAQRRPKIFLAQIGDSEGSRARAEFCAGLFPAGGIEVLPGSVAFFAASGCRSAVLAASDEICAAQGADAARALKEAGCGWLLLAGRPGANEAELRAAGVDAFVFLGADVVEVLAEILRREQPR